MCTKKQPDKSLRPRVYIVPAVTTTKLIGDAPNSQAEPSKKKGVTQTPAALREGVRGRRFSQRSGLPRRSPTPCASPGGSAREGLLAEKPPSPTPSPLKLAGRGGSVSRRDHSPAAGHRVQLAWAHKPEGTHKPIPSHSSGEGVWGRGASLREAASPPASPSPPFFGRGLGGGAS